MAYASLQEQAQAFGTDEMSQLMSDEQPLVTQQLLEDHIAGNLPGTYSAEQLQAIADQVSRVEAILDRQSATMDSFIAKRYQLPIIASAISGTPLKECCLALSRAAFADDRDNLSEPMEKEQKYWREWLLQISKGTAVLIGVSSAEENIGQTDHRYLTGCPRSKIDWGRY